MNQSAARSRCLAVAGGATGLLAALAAFLAPDLDAAVAHARAGGLAAEPFEELLVAGCAVAALLAASWLWAVTCLVAVRAARGHGETTRAVPIALRRLVLVACGAALAGAGSVPAGAAPGAAGGIAGLPLPDRATGAASSTTSAVAATPVVRPSRAGRAAATALTPDADVLVVRPGDTLWQIAVRHLPPGAGAAEVTGCWQRIHELNRAVIGDDPDLIHPGQRLRLPHRWPGPTERKQP